MNISKMIKRMTGDIKYLLIAVIIVLCVAVDVFNFFSIIASVEIMLLMAYVASILAKLSLLVYALNYHGTKGSKLTLYAYFILESACSFISFLRNSSFSIAPMILILMVLLIGFGGRGIPMYVLTLLGAVALLIPVFIPLMKIGFFGLLPLLALLLPVIVFIIAGFLGATATK